MKKLSLSLLADTVISRRKALKMTQTDLAKKAGMNRSMLSKLETQDYTPSIGTLAPGAYADIAIFDLKDKTYIQKDFCDDEIECSQIQYLDGKLYISPVLNCFDGSVLSLLMRDNMRKELCIDTVKAAARRNPHIRGTIYHSDRGIQYTSEEFMDTLKSLDMTQSLSGVDCCYDNARMESSFDTLNKELLYRLPTYRMTKEDVKTIVFRYIFTYYNTVLIHTSNPGGLAPVAYRMTWNQEEMAV